MNAEELRDRISVARKQHQAGAGAVLDVLLRSHGRDVKSMVDALRSMAGVEVILSATDHCFDGSVVDAATAASMRCAVVLCPSGETMLAAEDPWDEEAGRKIAAKVGRLLRPAAITRATLAALLQAPPGPGAATSGVSRSEQAEPPAESDRTRPEGPIVSFVDSAVRAAFADGASDIHFECDRSGVTVKHRIDGVLKWFARLEGPGRAEEAISRIKVLAQLDITERRLPQDGRFRMLLGHATVDLRVSIMPSVFGEDAVLRLLDKAQLRTRDDATSLALLGFNEEHSRLIRQLANEPSGMLLVTGPTGSGKTTTLYAVLTEIGTGHEKIITIEDPVEYELPGVLQIPVNERKGLTFAKGLRSILRHDPDRILVGEIRDSETAEIAVQSALTGHLVFTTVHANSVADIIGRFRYFGLDMFGFMSSLNGVIVQRLVRRLCPHCVSSRPLSNTERHWMSEAGHTDCTQAPVAVGCLQCNEAGYRGRFVIAEVHLVDDAFRDHVTEGSALSVLRHYAREKKVESLAAQAASHVRAGRTSLEEVKRVVGWL